MSYAQAGERARSELDRQENIGRRWESLNFNQAQQNTKQNFATDLYEAMQLGAPTAERLLKEHQKRQDYNARMSELLDPTGLSVASAAEFGDKISERSKEGAALYAKGLDQLGFRPEIAEKLDYAQGLRSRQINATKWHNQKLSGLLPHVQNAIDTSNIVFKTEDGRLIDLSKGIDNAEDHALVSNYFAQEYIKTTGILELGTEFNLSLETGKKIDKGLVSLHAQFVKKNNQEKEFIRKQEVRDELIQKLDKGEEPDWDYFLNRISTFTNKKGERLSFAEMHDWLFDYAKELAQTDIERAEILEEKLISGKFSGPGGARVNFAKTRVDNFSNQIADNLKTNADRTEVNKLRPYYKIKQNFNQGDYANEDGSLNKGAFYKAAGEAGLSLSDVSKIVASANNVVDGEDEAQWLRSATSLTQDDVNGVSAENQELAQSRFNELDAERKLYKPNTQLNRDFKFAEEGIDTASNFGNKITGTSNDYKTEQGWVAHLAKKELIRQYKMFLPGLNNNHSEALRQATEAVLGNRSTTWGLMGNPENIDDVRKGFFWQLHLKNQDSTIRGITKSGNVFFNQNSFDLDASKADFGLGNLKEDPNLQFIVSNMSERDRTDIKNYNSTKTGGEQTPLFKALYQGYTRKYKSKDIDNIPMDERDFARFLSQVLGTPTPQSQESKELNNGLDTLSKIPGAERIIQSYIKTKQCRTAGTLAQYFAECRQAQTGVIQSQQPDQVTFGGP